MNRNRWEQMLPQGLAEKLGRENLDRIKTPDQTALHLERRARAKVSEGITSLGHRALNRRGFVLQSLKVGGVAATLPAVSACMDGGNNEPADGTFENPWTAAEPGIDPNYHVPIVYPAQSDATNVRLWVEVLDPNLSFYHPQDATHYVQQIVVTDGFDNDIGASAFRFDNDARLILQVTLPEEVVSIKVYEQCNLHGWWLSEWVVSDLMVPPIGDLRRPYTLALPGELPAKHEPLFGKRPNGDMSVEIGDRNSDDLHPMEDAHYEGTILVFDQYSQLRAGTYLDPNFNPEPVYDFDPVGGTGYVRLICWCNLHGWWEAVYSVA